MTTNCPTCYGRPQGECPDCGTRGRWLSDDRWERIAAVVRAVLATDSDSVDQYLAHLRMTRLALTPDDIEAVQP